MMTETKIKRNNTGARSPIFLGIFGFLCLFFFCAFCALGTWQVERLGWKENLIRNANERVHLAPVTAPAKNDWQNVTYDKDEYRPVKITGKFLNDKEILVTAVADETTGYWVLTPLETDDGSITFINRGFVPMDKHDISTREMGNIEGNTTVTGLLRMSEGGGFYPRKNNPQDDKWYTRQLPAMAQKLGLTDVAPYFIDADKTSNAGELPIGGLTVVTFTNNHLSYAITWFTLATGVFGASIFLILTERKRRRGISNE